MNQNRNFMDLYKKNKSCKTFIIAEAGVHHGCRLDTAKKFIDAAARAGADAIKFQTYKANTLVTTWAPIYWQHSNSLQNGTQFDYFEKRDKFGFKEYRALSEYAAKRDIIFCSTPFDQQSVKCLNDLNIPFWKIASGDIDNYPLLEEIAKTQKPIILSTGASYLSEILETVRFLQTMGVTDLALLHCNLAYPTPDREANLLRIIKLRKTFPEILIGYSDHTIPDDGVTIPALAVALGAKIVEKHFTLDRTLPEDDHYHSVDPVMLDRMIQGIKLAEDATSLFTEITDSEIPARRNARRSLVANENIAKGSILNNEMVIPKRPGGGISPSLINKIVGRKVKTSIQMDQQISWGCLD